MSASFLAHEDGPPRLSGRRQRRFADNTPNVRFSATLGEEPEVELGLI
jgi:hypothetical protein